MLNEWRWPLLGVAAVFLAIGFAFAFTIAGTRLNRTMVWTGAALWLFALGFPYVADTLAAPRTTLESVRPVPAGVELAEVHLRVEGMT